MLAGYTAIVVAGTVYILRGVGISGGHSVSRHPGTEATRACGIAHPGYVAVPVGGGGECLYNSVGFCLLESGIRHPAWNPGPWPHDCAGNMRHVLLDHCKKALHGRKTVSRMLRLLRRRGDPRARELRRRRDSAELSPWKLFADGTKPERSELGEVMRRISTPGEWGYYPEVALLAQLFGVCITVFSARDGKVAYGETGLDSAGRAIQNGTRCPTKLMILNTNREHFEPLRRCGANIPERPTLPSA